MLQSIPQYRNLYFSLVLSFSVFYRGLFCLYCFFLFCFLCPCVHYSQWRPRVFKLFVDLLPINPQLFPPPLDIWDIWGRGRPGFLCCIGFLPTFGLYTFSVQGFFWSPTNLTLHSTMALFFLIFVVCFLPHLSSHTPPKAPSF